MLIREMVKKYFRWTVALVGVMFVCGCLAPSQRQGERLNTASSPLDGGYRSLLEDPQAKAWFGYSRYRMLGHAGRWDDALSAINDALVFDPQSSVLQLELARTRLKLKQPQAAVAVLKNLLEAEPDNLEARELIGNLYSYLNQYDNAAESYRELLSHYPGHVPVEMMLAAALKGAGRGEEALEVLDGVLQRNPQQYNAQLLRAAVLTLLERRDEALEQYREVLDSYPDHIQTLLSYGRLLGEREGDAEEVLYLDALERNPQATGVRQRLGQLYLLRDNYAAAYQQFRLLLEQFPDNSRLLARVSMLAFRLERWPEVEQGIRQLRRLDSERDPQHYYLAVALAGQDRYDEAIGELEQIPDEEVKSAEVALQLSYYYSRVGRTEDATALLQGLIDKGQTSVDIYYYLAVFEVELKHYEKARRTLKAGLIDHPGNTRLLYQLGIVQEKTGETERAASTMLQILDIDGDHADALNYLAYFQAELGEDLLLALTRARRAYELMPRGYIADTLGWVLYKLERYDESLIYLSKAGEEIRDDAVVMEHLGDVYYKLQRRQEAWDSYHRAFELNSENRDARERLEQKRKDIAL